MYTLPRTIHLPPSKPMTVELLRELGRGVFGVVIEAVIDERLCALKLYDDESAFIREHRAYACVAKTPSIHAQTAAFIGIFDRIPELFPDQTHLYSRGICIERIDGPSLSDVIVTLSAAQRDAIRMQLRDALGLLHEDARVVHGDLRGDNVILAEGQARLIDFSHAGFKYDMAPWLWDMRKAKDFELLDRIFKVAEEMMIERKIRKILDNLTSSIIVDTEKQSELAEILYNSSLSSILLASIEKRIPYPTPVLALSLTRAYKQSGKMEDAIKFAKSYLSCIKEIGYKSSDIQEFLMLKITFARYQSILSFQTGITLYHETVAEFTKFLGEKHICTLQAQFECAQLWFHEQRSIKTSLTQCMKIISTLYQSGNDSGDGIVNFQDSWKDKVLKLIQACMGHLDYEDLLRRKVDHVLTKMGLL